MTTKRIAVLAALALGACAPAPRPGAAAPGPAGTALRLDVPPAPLELRPAEFPPVQTATLSSGLELMLVRQDRLPLVTVSLMFPAGATRDPEGREGAAQLVASTLTKGAGGRSAEEISRLIEGRGGTLAAGAGDDVLMVWSDVLRGDVALAMELLADAVVRPDFDQGEVEVARRQLLSALALVRSQPTALAEQLFAQHVYGEHPYGRVATEQSVAALTRADLQAFHQRYLRPGGATLVVAGDVSLDEARRLAERHFAGWTGEVPEAAPAAAPAERAATEILLVHRPGSAQSSVVVGNLVPGASSPQRHAAIVANAVLGAGADARLFRVLREEKGWTYGAYSELTMPRGPGTFRATAQVRPEVTDSAIVEMLRQIRRLGTEPLPAADLDDARGQLVGSFPLEVQTVNQLAGKVRELEARGLSSEELRTHRLRLAAVTAEQARQAAADLMRPDRALVLVVGDATQLLDGLRAIAPVRVVDETGREIPAADLAPQAEPLPVDPARLVLQRDSFEIRVQGQPFGYQAGGLARIADGFRYTEETRMGAAVQQTTVVTLGPDLAPRRVEMEGAVQGQPVRTDVAYAAGRATGTSSVPGPQGVEEVRVDAAVPAGAIPDNLLQALLPALPWSADARWSFPVFDSARGQSRTLTLAVAGLETVTTAAGEVEAYRASLTGGQQPVDFWVEAAPPHRVLRMAVVGAPVEFHRVP